MAADTARKDPFAGALDSTARLPGVALPWIAALREEARGHYAALGPPTVKLEDWKYTNLNRLSRIGFAPDAGLPPVKVDTVPVGSTLSAEAHLAVLVNGRFRPDLSSLPEGDAGPEIASLAELLERAPDALQPVLGRIASSDSMPLVALNTALWQDGLAIRFKPGAAIEKPVHVVSIGAAGDAPRLFHPRLLILAEENSRGCVLESHVGVGDGVYFSNAVAEIAVEPGAALRHYKLQNEHPAAFHVAAAKARLVSTARYESFVLQVGGRLARNEIHARLGGESIDCRLAGAYLLRGDQHGDNTTFIDHAAPNSNSREVYKGVLDDNARGVFQGKILVRKDAQKTDGHQLNKALMLSRGAEIDSKPELEIYADDVKCSHGATAGEIDEDALFYLRSRGIDAHAARGLLVEAFVGEAIDEIEDDAARAAFRNVVDGWLTEGKPDGPKNED